MTRASFACVFAPLLLALGCGWNYEPSDNVLPSPPAAEGSSSDADSDDPTLDTDSAETGEPATDFPATYRFDCMDIKAVGDADPEVFQVATLQTTWAADIANFKLNILVDVLSEDPDTGAGEITIRSGVGTGWSDQCGQGQGTDSAMFELGYDPAITLWEPSAAEGQCASAIDSAGGAGTYTLDLGAQDQVFIYSEDNDGTSFNCSLDAGKPNAIPVYALKASISLTEDRSQMAGTLTACMVESEALQICSCLGVCAGNVHPDCEGCPGGAVPLGLLLGGINSTQACTELMGETAYDFVFEFRARRLPAVPESCG